MRCLNAICEGGDARYRQVAASYYYGEIAERGAGPVLKELALIAMHLVSLNPAAEESALPIFYTHPEVTGQNPSIEYTNRFARNPVNPQALTPIVRIGGLSTGEVHRQFPLMGMVGRPSVVHFAGVTQWTFTGKQMNGIRLIQIHPTAARRAGIENGDEIIVESPRGAVNGTALIWEGIREDTIFVPNTFGPLQKLAQELGVPEYEPANHLLDDRFFDNLSGQQAYKCFACRVRKA